MSSQMNELLLKKNLILGIGRLVTTDYRVLPSIRYSAEPSNRTEYRFSPNNGSSWEWRPLGVAAPASGGSWEWRPLGVAARHLRHTSIFPALSPPTSDSCSRSNHLVQLVHLPL